MNRHLLLGIFIFASYLLGAQNIEIYDNRDNLITSDQEYVAYGTIGEDLYLHFGVKYVGNSDSIGVKIRKQVFELHGNSSFTFCWGSCFPPHILVSPNPIYIQQGEYSAYTLDLDFFPDETLEGISKVAMTAFDVANPGDSVRIIVKFDFTTTSVGHTNKLAIKLYPNPTQGELTITGGYGRTVRVFNAIGQLTFSKQINSEEETLDLSFMKSGIYMVQLSENGKIIETRKLIKR